MNLQKLFHQSEAAEQWGKRLENSKGQNAVDGGLDEIKRDNSRDHQRGDEVEVLLSVTSEIKRGNDIIHGNHQSGHSQSAKAQSEDHAPKLCVAAAYQSGNDYHGTG